MIQPEKPTELDEGEVLEQKIQPQKSFLSYFWWIFAVIIISVVVFIFIISGKKQENNISNNKPDPVAIYITANPLDLSQIRSISMFRSCIGHDYSGRNFKGEIETDRSMKHYVTPIEPLRITTDKVKIFAPFDGEIFEIIKPKTTDTNTPEGYGGAISVVSPLEENAAFEFGHVNYFPELKEGDKVKAGQLLGYAFVKNSSFDLTLRAIINSEEGKYQMSWIFDSMFDRMTSDVLAEFEKFGFNKDKMSISKEYRDQNLCKTYDDAIETEVVYSPQGYAEWQKEFKEREKSIKLKKDMGLWPSE